MILEDFNQFRIKVCFEFQLDIKVIRFMFYFQGEFTHEDFCGHKGTLKAGDLQWMTAGRGVVHSEMPGFVDTRGLQVCFSKDYIK